MGHAELSPGIARWRAFLGARWPAQLSAALLLGVWVCEISLLLSWRPWLSHLAMGALVAFLGLALLRASSHIRLLFAVVCTVAGGLTLWQHDAAGVMKGLSQAQIFGGFLPSVLLLRATVQLSPHRAHLQDRIGLLSSAQAQHWTLLGSHALSAVLNVGAMAVIAPVVTRGADANFRAQLAVCAARGVGASIMWSPIFVAMAFTSSLVPAAPLWQVMGLGAGLAVMALVLAQAIFIPGLKASEALASVRALWPLTLPMSFLLGGVLLLTVWGYSGLQAVTLALPALCIPYLCTRGVSVVHQACRATWGHFSRLSDELLIIVGAQVMGVCLAGLPEVQHAAQTVLPSLVSGGLLITLLVVTLVSLGQLGLHPMIGVSLLVPMVSTGPFGIAPIALVSAGVFAWGLSAALAVWTLPVAVAATTFEVPVSRLLTRQGAWWGVLTGALGCAYLAGINAWLVH